jgi:hypothetical protein
MDESEKIASSYLANLGFESIVFEPDGNVPPDFLADARIAVEVRRLNQNELTQSGFRSLEEVAIPLQMKIGKLLASLGPANQRASWFVHYSLKRPLLPWDQLAFKLQQCLEEFRDDPRDEKPTSITIDDCLEVKLLRAGDPHSTFFVSGGYHDDDSGGWVLAETQRNLRLCIEEKTRKIAPFRHKYREWWLVLIDRIGYGVSDCDRDLFREHLKLEHDWDRIALVNPLDPRSAFELYRSRHRDKEEM